MSAFALLTASYIAPAVHSGDAKLPADVCNSGPNTWRSGAELNTHNVEEHFAVPVILFSDTLIFACFGTNLISGASIVAPVRPV